MTCVDLYCYFNVVRSIIILIEWMIVWPRTSRILLIGWGARFTFPCFQSRCINSHLKTIVNKKAVLSQGEPRDAAVNFDTYRFLQRHRAVLLPHTARLSCWSSSAGNRQRWPSLLFKVPEEAAKEIAKKCHRRQPRCRLTPLPWGTPANIRICLIETKIIDLHFVRDNVYLSSFKFFWSP